MEWHDEGLVLGCRKHGETSVILEVMTWHHGRTLGLVRGGRSRKQQPTLQPGNRIALTWRARLEDHLGMITVEPIAMRAASLMETPSGVLGIQLIAAHLRLLPERESLPGVFEAVDAMVTHLPDALDAAELMVRFEIALLQELGFGLDLQTCAMTGAREGLAFVSPKTGRAVTQEAGQPWADKLLALPPFLRAGANMRPDGEMLASAFALTGYFFTRNVYEPRGVEMPHARESFVRAVTALKPENGAVESCLTS
jgi:DNA repair protein RecO (recombination protein O)